MNKSAKYVMVIASLAFGSLFPHTSLRAEGSNSDATCGTPNYFDKFSKYGSCWNAVFTDKSVYYIKGSDRGSQFQGILFSNEGWTGSSPKDVWVKGDHSMNRELRYRTSFELYRLSCSGSVGRYALIHRTLMDAKGRVLEDRDIPYTKMRIARPGGREEAFAFAVCRDEN
jgi:hypothetical protein